MTASKIFLYFCLSFIGGVFLSSFFNFPKLFLFWIFIFGLTLISTLWKEKKAVAIGFCVLFFVFGAFRFLTFESKILRFNELIDKKYSFYALITEEPIFGEKVTKLVVKIKNKREEGKILITTDRYPEYSYGDKLKVSGEIKLADDNIDGFNYRKYLEKDGIFGVMEWPKIEVVGQDFGSSVFEILFSIKDKFNSSLNKIMSPPESGIMSALFFGDEDDVSKEWKDKFNITGTRHISAVSGMNITIIVSILMSFLLWCGFWRNQVSILTVAVLFFYILMIGAPASAIRAGIMGGLLVVSQMLGRYSLAWRAIIFSAAVMLFLNPFLLRFDVGFQLSFFAMLGMIFVGPYFFKKLSAVPQFFGIRLALSSTISAQIFTFPILIYNFGRISLISIFANILIVPFLPLVTILGFISILVAVFWTGLGQIFSWPAWFFLSYFVKVIDFFSKIPVSLSIGKVSWIFIPLFYFFLFIFIYKSNRKTKPV
jgi:competence protein ComEC